MKPNTALCIATALVILAPVLPSVRAQGANDARQLTESQIANLLKQLESLQEQLLESKKDNNAKAIDVFRQAADSDKAAYALFLNCVKSTQFDKEEKRESAFREWKSNNSEFHQSKEHLAILRLQLHFIVATIAISEAKKFEDALPAINFYLDFFTNVEKAIIHPRKLNGRSIGRLRQAAGVAVFSTPFAKFYKLDLTITPPSGWPASPREVGGVFDDFLLPYYRSAGKGEMLIATWDKRIAQARSFATIHREEDDLRAYNEFIESTLPTLQWGRARDVFSHQNQLAGATAMLGLIKINLSHPGVNAWLGEFTSLVSQGTTSAPTAETTNSATDTATNTDDTKTLRELLKK